MNILDHFKNISVIQIGCGGTGSWLVPYVSKLLNNIRLRMPEDSQVMYKLVDDDTVEERNILRQNFNSWDIGKSKAIALLGRNYYSLLETQAITTHIKTLTMMKHIIFKSKTFPIELLQKTLTIVLGCVDNNKSRQHINNFLKKIHTKTPSPMVYLDAGNLLYNGQVVTMSYGYNEFIIEKLHEFNQEESNKLKLKTKKKINFNKMFEIPKENEEAQQSCAFFGDQTQAMNIMAATILFCNLQKILINSEIPPNIITFNSSGYSTFEL
jgi:molybdopterin/thiamine biosynthesis adenylyltransferase